MKKIIGIKRNKGFSLVELIVIIAIMSILAAAIGIYVIRYLEKARQAKDVYHASLIKDALTAYEFPSNFQGRAINYTDPDTGETETYTRGWVYVDQDEIRCSDQSTALALIDAGLVYVSDETIAKLEENEEESVRWFPSGPDGDYIRRTNIDEYAFKSDMTVKARNTWNTFQLDVYIDDGGELHLGASASNAVRTSGHSKDTEAATLMAKKLGFTNAMVTPIGEQYKGN